METAGTWISGNRCRECLIDTGIEPARRHTAPGHLHPCSRAGNTPPNRHIYYTRIEKIATAILTGLAIIIALVFAYYRS